MTNIVPLHNIIKSISCNIGSIKESNLSRFSNHIKLVSNDRQPREAIAYSDAIQSVAEQYNAIILLRNPNPMSFGLLKDGHATKGFKIKAKTSETGPTAGFVPSDARFTKSSQSLEKQQHAIEDSKRSGAQERQIYLTNDRIYELAKKGQLSIESESPETKLVSAKYPHAGVVHFRLKFDKEKSAFAVFELPDLPFKSQNTEIPVKGLTNCPIESEPTKSIGHLDIVTADYDLFAIYPHGNQSNNHRCQDIPARVTLKNTTEKFNQYSSRYLNSTIRKHDPEDSQMGNISRMAKAMIQNLNNCVKSAGFDGGKLFHHSDETFNPYSEAPDFPLAAFIPGESTPRWINDSKELLDFHAEARTKYFAPNLNNRWSLRSF